MQWGKTAMPDVVRTGLVDGVAQIIIDSPPVNALGQAVRMGLYDAIDQAEADPDVGAIVLIADGTTWPAGADIREFGQPATGPTLPELCMRVAGCTKPVVAALHGTALGGGLELALCARFRIAAVETQLGFPEVKLGILPGAGGTQRAPRLIGAGASLRMMLSGDPIDADEAARLGLVDHVVSGNPDQAALAVGLDLAASGPLPPRAGDPGLAEPDGFITAIAAARSKPEPTAIAAHERIINCVEAALLLPLEAGLSFERTAFEELLASPESQALCHAFLSERRAAKIPDLAGVQPRSVQHIGIVGGSAMSIDLTQLISRAGFQVTLVRQDPPSVTNLSRLSECDLIVEAGPEDEAGKTSLMIDLAQVTPADAILATVTDHPGVTRVAKATGRQEDVLGLHFFAPVGTTRLVEIIRHADTAPPVLAAGFAFVQRLGKVGVLSGDTEGFIANRMLRAYAQAVGFLLAEGATPTQIDEAMRAYGFATNPPRPAPPETNPPSDRALSDDEIQQRCLAAMANEGARILLDGTADRASDIDVAMMAGYGFPRYRGGPMLAADQAGLLNVRNRLHSWADMDPGFWAPVPLWDELIKNGARFADLNEA